MSLAACTNLGSIAGRSHSGRSFASASAPDSIPGASACFVPAASATPRDHRLTLLLCFYLCLRRIVRWCWFRRPWLGEVPRCGHRTVLPARTDELRRPLRRRSVSAITTSGPGATWDAASSATCLATNVVHPVQSPRCEETACPATGQPRNGGRERGFDPVQTTRTHHANKRPESLRAPDVPATAEALPINSRHRNRNPPRFRRGPGRRALGETHHKSASTCRPGIGTCLGLRALRPYPGPDRSACEAEFAQM